MGWIGMVAQLAGTAAGQAASQMDRDEAMRLIKASTDAYGKIQVPKLKELFLSQQGKTGLAGIKDDPRYRDQQNAADSQLNDIISHGGLTLADKAALNAIRNRTARTESAGRNAILGGMAARGTLDSGAQLAAQLQGNQQSANELASADEATAGQAQARAFEAIRERARNAGQGLDRDYRQKSDAARAQDAINAGNTAILNTAAKYNSGLPQQNFHNELDLAGAQSGANSRLAAATAGRAKDTQDLWQGVGNVAGAGAKAYGSSGSNGAGFPPPTPALEPESPDQWNSYPGSSDALTSRSTRDDEEDILRDSQGRPIPRGSNF